MQAQTITTPVEELFETVRTQDNGEMLFFGANPAAAAIAALQEIYAGAIFWALRDLMDQDPALTEGEATLEAIRQVSRKSQREILLAL